jgi:hypothetical protein
MKKGSRGVPGSEGVEREIMEKIKCRCCEERVEKYYCYKCYESLKYEIKKLLDEISVLNSEIEVLKE